MLIIWLIIIGLNIYIAWRKNRGMALWGTLGLFLPLVSTLILLLLPKKDNEQLKSKNEVLFEVVFFIVAILFSVVVGGYVADKISPKPFGDSPQEVHGNTAILILVLLIIAFSMKRKIHRTLTTFIHQKKDL